jgi:hypothetical protein
MLDRVFILSSAKLFVVKLSVVILTIIMLSIEYRDAGCSQAVFYGECHYTLCHYDTSHNTRFDYAQCNGRESTVNRVLGGSTYPG